MSEMGRPRATYAIPYLEALEGTDGGWLSFKVDDVKLGAKVTRWIRMYHKDVQVSHSMLDPDHMLYLRKRT